jgi:hypothetical protein
MKNFIFLFAILLILTSCSSSGFLKRKYTEGVFVNKKETVTVVNKEVSPIIEPVGAEVIDKKDARGNGNNVEPKIDEEVVFLKDEPEPLIEKEKSVKINNEIRNFKTPSFSSFLSKSGNKGIAKQLKRNVEVTAKKPAVLGLLKLVLLIIALAIILAIGIVFLFLGGHF